jgi:hypothetical protein
MFLSRYVRNWLGAEVRPTGANGRHGDHADRGSIPKCGIELIIY